MAKNCIACGKNIGLLTIRISLLGNDALLICSECFDKMPPVLNDLYQNRIFPNKTELLEIKNEVIRSIKESNYNQDTINVVTKYLDDKIAKKKTKESREDGKLLKKCPVCGKNINYDREICSGCGYIFSATSEIEYGEIAKMYNNRLVQYKKIHSMSMIILLYAISRMVQRIKKA